MFYQWFLKNTGVGCHFLLQCMKVKSESEDAQSCLTLSDPMDCSLRGSSVHGIVQAGVLEWGAIAFSEQSPYCVAFTHFCGINTATMVTNMRSPDTRPGPSYKSLQNWHRSH